MPEGNVAATIADRALGFAVRRIRMLTLIILVGGVGLIAAHGASWTSIAFVSMFAIALAFGWAALAFWVWVFRNSGKPRGNLDVR